MFFRKTLDDVLSSFKKTIHELEIVASAENERANDLEEECKRIAERKRKAKLEAGRATRVADKLSKLIEEEE